MSDLILTNPARRLYRILERGKQGKWNNVQEGLSGLFHVDPKDLSAVFSKYAGLLALIEDVGLRIQALESNHREHLLHCIPPLRRALFENVAMTNGWKDIMNRISSSDLGLLHFAAVTLDSVQIEIEIPQSDLDDVAKQANELFETVRTSQQLEPQLRVILLDLLESIRRTITDYQIRGAEGLKKVLAECLGRMALDREIVLKSQDKPEMKKFWEVVKNVGALFSASNQAPQLGERIGNLINMTLT
jgi:hypothetical protein